MEQQYLIDSNAVIDYLSGTLPEKGILFMNKIINNIPNVSVITKIEVLGFKTNIKANLLLTEFIDDSVVIDLTDEIVEQTIYIRKEYKIKTPDAIIAATAIVNDLNIVTRNIKDFDKIKGVSVVNPHDK